MVRLEQIATRSRCAVLCILTLLVVSACSVDSLESSNVSVDSQAINGGTSTSNETWPWSVKVAFNGQWRCGGSLIAPDWVLTVAHCLTLAPGTGYSVTLGSGEIISASEVLRHPDYVDDQAVTGHFDMGLIHLATPAVASSTVGFIRPALDGDAPGTTATAIGWGMINHDQYHPEYPGQLQQVSLPIVDNSYCNDVLPQRHVIYPDELCAGSILGATGVCFGDSGSPLMVERTPGVWEHIGVPAGVHISPIYSGLVCASHAIFGRTSAMVGWVRHYAPDPAWFSSLNLITM